MLLSYIALICEFKYHRQNRTPARCQTIKTWHTQRRRRATQELCSQHIIERIMPCTFPVPLSLMSKSKSSRHHQTKWKIESKTTKVCIANENVNRIDGEGDGMGV